MRVTLSTLQKMAQEGNRITQLTCYDASFAALLDAPVVAGAFHLQTRRYQGTSFLFAFLDTAVGFDTELPTDPFGLAGAASAVEVIVTAPGRQGANGDELVWVGVKEIQDQHTTRL